MEVLGKFKIIYSNGVNQEKILISQEEYKNTIKPKLEEIIKLESELIGLGKKNKRRVEIEDSIKKIEDSINIGEFFTSESPLGKALTTGILVLPNCQGGNQHVKFRGI